MDIVDAGLEKRGERENNIWISNIQDEDNLEDLAMAGGEIHDEDEGGIKVEV